MTRKASILVPTAFPFGFKPVSIFGLFKLTMFNERSHMLTGLITLASLRCDANRYTAPYGYGVSLSTVRFIVRGLVILLGYC